MKSNWHPRRWFLTALVLSSGFAAKTAHAQEPYFVGKSQAFVQTSSTGAVPASTAPFNFRASGSTAITLTLPGGGTVTPTLSDESYELVAGFATKAALDAAYPNGTYQMSGTGLAAISFNLSTDAYPAATPQVVGGTWNSGGLLVVDPTQAATITFSTFSDYATGGVAGHMDFSINGLTSSSNNLELGNQIATQSVFGLQAQTTPLTSFVIPAGSLVSGQPYRAELSFDTLTTLNTTASAVALFSKTLSFYIAAQTPGTTTPAPVIVTPPANQTAPLGSSVIFSVAFTVGGSSQINFNNTALEWTFNGQRLNFDSTKYVYGGTPSTQTLQIKNLTAADVGSYAVTVVNAGGVATSSSATYAVGPATPPVFTAQPTSIVVSPGSSAVFNSAANGALSYQWQRNGTAIAGATNAGYFISGANLIPGTYTVVATNAGGSVTSRGAVLALSTTAKLDGAGTEVGSDIPFPNGNVYDQVLLTGSSATIKADAGQVVRISFLDLDDDIVQVEFAGAGRLFLSLENSSGPAAPVKYNQATVNYMRGHASIVISGADETTNVSVFTVGRATAFDPTGVYNFLQTPSATNNPANNGSSLFAGRSATIYDGHASIGSIAILSTNGKFGGVRTANASYFNTKGTTGLYAPGVQFQGPVFVGDITAADDANPVLVLGSASDVRITGGDLLQTNGRAVAVSGITQLKFAPGSDSHGNLEAAQINRARLEQNGTDVTSQIVVNPTP